MQAICSCLPLALVVLACCCWTINAQVTGGCLASKAGLDYVGFQAVTKSVKTCVSWSLTPFNASDSIFPERNVSLARNYCRNPGYSKTTIWCYTNATSLEFDFCDTVAICQSNCRHTEAGQEYNGAQQTDVNGTSCLSWASVNRIGADYFQYDRTLADANTYCRNVPPDTTTPSVLSSAPWCYVNASWPTLSQCSVPFCTQLTAGGCRTDRLGLLYRGSIGAGISGRACLAWNASGVYTAGNWPIAGEAISAAGSACRNPNNSSVGLWCFVSATEWEPCMVPVCEPKTSCPSSSSDYYRYRLNQTQTGCQSWSSAYSASASTWYSFTQLPPGASAVLSEPLFHPAHLPDTGLAAAGAYCRNPDNDATGPWCPSPAGGKLYCPDPCNNVTCKTSHSTKNYIGIVSRTRRGTDCQKWLARYPWLHSYHTSGSFPDQSITAALNLCRNPDGNPFGPWCIKAGNFTDGDFWDFCDIPVCDGFSLPGPASPTNTDECIGSSFGFTYAGTKSVTGTGRVCQRWDSQWPHPHPYYLPQMFNALTVSDAANYCRNPNNDTNGPWCFTVDSSIRFEYCNISVCTPIYPPAVEGLLAFIGVLGVQAVLLTGIAMAIILVQLLVGYVAEWHKQRQQQQQAHRAVEPKIKPVKAKSQQQQRQKEQKQQQIKERKEIEKQKAQEAKEKKEREKQRAQEAREKEKRKAQEAKEKKEREKKERQEREKQSKPPKQQQQQQHQRRTASPDATLDRRMYRRDSAGQSQPKFSHNNAVMKAMANSGDEQPEAWALGGGEQPGLAGSLHPIREEELQQRQSAIVIDPQPPQRVRETETLERRLDFDVESLESASLPKRTAAYGAFEGSAWKAGSGRP